MVGIVMNGVLWLPPPRTDVLCVQHCVACGSVSWAWLSLSMVFLLPRGQRLCGEWPLVSALGTLLDIPSFPAEGAVVQGQVKLVLPGLSSPGGFCPTSLPYVTALQSSGVLTLCSSVVGGENCATVSGSGVEEDLHLQWEGQMLLTCSGI